MSKQIIEQIIREVLQEQVEAFQQIRDFDKRFPWFGEVMSSLSDRIAQSKTQVAMEDVGDGVFKVSFTGPADVLFAILNGLDNRHLSAKHHRPKNPWDDSTLIVFLESEVVDED